jgi:hypothetical protein
MAIWRKITTPQMDFSITVDVSELIADLEKIENGELQLPTVLAVKVAEFKDEIPIYLEVE